MADFDGKDVAVVGGAALLLYLVLGKSGDAVAKSQMGSLDALARCEVFLQADGSLRVNGKTSTLGAIANGCAKRIELRASGAAKQGDLEALVRSLRARGFQVVSR